MPTARIRNDLATAKIRTEVPTVKVKYSSVLTPGTDSLIHAGTPIGLLLALTYAWNTVVNTPATFKGDVPTARIRNT